MTVAGSIGVLRRALAEGVVRGKLDGGFIFEFGLEVPLCISYSSSKDIEHLGLFRSEVVLINVEFSLYLDSLVLKGRVYAI